FAEGIGKLAENTVGDCRKKTGRLTARMSEAAKLAGNNPCMKMDFPRWEEGDPIRWILRMEYYFQFYRTADATWLEIRGEVKTQQPYTLMAAISFARIQEERLNHEVQRTRVAPQPAMLRPTSPSTAIWAPALKKLTRDELHECSAKGWCWHCDEPWSREHHCKKGQLLVIEPVEDEDSEPSEEGLEPKEKAIEEEPQPADYVVHALAGYSNL
ncbi:hypothetical protein BHE74_00018897, partial [Ensete ventricosum]